MFWKLRFIGVIWSLFFLCVSAWGGTKPVLLFLSWNLKPYWDFVEGFQETKFFKTYPEVLNQEEIFGFKKIETASVLIPLGHRALNYLSHLNLQKPLFAALIVAPEFIQDVSDSLIGGIYLRLPPEIFLPLLREHLSLLFPNGFRMGIPYTDPGNQSFVLEAQKMGPWWQITVISLPLSTKDKKSLSEIWPQIDVLYLVPDPFLESEEAVEQIIKDAFLHRKIVVGYNKFFFKKGAFISFVIDYKDSGRKGAQILKMCLEKKSYCGWHPASFKILVNKKLLKFYRKNADKKH